MSSLLDLPALRDSAVEAARAAGAVLREPTRALREVSFSDAHDVKLAADTAAERIIREILARGSDLPVFGEELGGEASLVDDGVALWVVDPLDGTFNYQRDFPLCCVSIGLMRGTEPLLGVIYDFFNDALYVGGVAEPLTRNGTPLSPAWAGSLDQAALCTGFPAAMEKSDAALQDFVRLLQPYKKVRMIGSAAMALVLVAGGQADAYYEPGVRLWDVAAGAALVRAAGGVIRFSPSATQKTLAYDFWAAARAEFIL
jgi:myo-inositol-1(or 4)-monophosphatase